VIVKRAIFIVAGLLLTFGPAVRGDDFTGLIEQSIFGRYPLGLGARAWGMGGAQLAVLGDPAAASSWNPAGLAALRGPSVALSYASDNLRLIPGETGVNLYGSGIVVTGTIRERPSTASGSAVDFAAIALPFRLLGRPAAVQFSYRRQIPYSFQIDYGYAYRYSAYYGFDYDYFYSASPTGALDALTISMAAEVVPGLRAGVNLHRWSNNFTLPTQESYVCNLANYYGWDGSWREDMSERVELKATGVGADFGLLADVQGKIFAGAVFRTGFEAGLDYSNAAEYHDGYSGESFRASAAGQGRLAFPASFGYGGAVRPLPGLTVALDVVQAFWSRARIRNYARANARGGVPAARDYGFPTLRPPEVVGQRDSTSAHLGLEYEARLGSVRVPLRCGLFQEKHFFYDRQGERVASFGYALGLGLRFGGAALDLAWVQATAKGHFRRDSLKISLQFGLGAGERR